MIARQLSVTPSKGWLPLALITFLTIAIFAVSIMTLLSGWQTIFQNLFYFPIILACVYYVKRGFVFSVLLSCGYFALMALFSQDSVVLEGALIRVLIFILVAAVTTYLSLIRIRAEDALKESEEKFRGIFDTINDGIHIHEIEPDGRPGKFVEVNEIACRKLQYTHEELMEHSPLDLVTGYHSRPLDEILREQSTTGHAFFETEHRRKDGTILPVEINTHAVRLLGKRVMVSVVRDISDRKRAENLQRESERRLADIIDFLPDPTFVIDTRGSVIAWNYAISRLLDVGADEIIGKGNYEHAYRMFGHRRPVLIDLVLSGDEEVIKKHYPNLKKERGMLMAELEIPLLNGRRTVLWVIATPLYNAQGEITGAIESMRDITHIHDTEVQLRESEERLTDIIDFLPDPTFAIDNEGTVIAWNMAIEEMVGVSKADMLGKGDYAYTVPVFGEARPALIDLVLHEDQELEKEFTSLTRVGDQLIAEVFAQKLHGGKGEYLWMIASPLYDQHGAITGAIESIRIVTERKRVEEAFKEANKKLNLLSSITRHDINNQLSVLMGYLRLLEKKIPDPAFHDSFESITKASMRISSMIQFTKTYENIGVTAPVWQDVPLLIKSAAKDVALGEIQLVNDLFFGEEVFADPLIVKVFFNLMDNAVRYGGKITTIRFSVECAGDNRVIVCEDDGEGVPADEKEKIFERGFGKNTGLGLFLAREILGITSITLSETGKPGKGARFEMKIPKGNYRFNGNEPVQEPAGNE